MPPDRPQSVGSPALIKGTWHLDDTQLAEVEATISQKADALKQELGEGQFRVTERTPRSVKWEYALAK